MEVVVDAVRGETEEMFFIDYEHLKNKEGSQCSVV